MSKRLPYYQSEPAEYLTGDIMFCSYASQGVFSILRALYWQRDCDLTISQAKRRIPNADDLFDELIKEKIIKVKGENIIINFLDEQFEKAVNTNNKNKENGKKGGRPPKLKAKIGFRILYVVKLYNNNESFFKIGTTSTIISRRMGNIPYKYEVLFEEEIDTYKALEIESICYKELNNYTPDIKFGGYTECFKNGIEVLNKVKELIHNPNITQIKPIKIREDKIREDKRIKDNINNNNNIYKEIAVVEDINIIYNKFVDEVKKGFHSQWAEQTYMRLKIKKGTLTPLLIKFKSDLITNETLHKNIKELKTHLNNWLNKQEEVGKLKEYKLKSIGSL